MTHHSDGIDSAEVVDKRMRAVDLKVRAWSYRDIARELGVSVPTVVNWVKQELQRSVPVESREELRRVEQERWDKSERRMEEMVEFIKNAAAMRVDKGDDPSLVAVWMADELRKQEQVIHNIRVARAKLLGTNSPLQVSHTMKIRKDFDEEIEGLVSQLLGGGAVVSKPDEVDVDA